MLAAKKAHVFTFNELKCTCGGTFSLLDDSEAAEPPPELDSKLFKCKKCKDVSWCSPLEFGIDFWDDIQEFQHTFDKIK